MRCTGHVPVHQPERDARVPRGAARGVLQLRPLARVGAWCVCAGCIGRMVNAVLPWHAGACSGCVPATIVTIVKQGGWLVLFGQLRRVPQFTHIQTSTLTYTSTAPADRCKLCSPELAKLRHAHAPEHGQGEWTCVWGGDGWMAQAHLPEAGTQAPTCLQKGSNTPHGCSAAACSHAD